MVILSTNGFRPIDGWMEIQERVITSLGELIDAVTPAEPDPVTGRRRDFGVYHGSIRADHALLTSLDRLGGTDPPHTKRRLEAHILRNFARYSRPYLDQAPVNDWELLVIAQHHGVPTRLLDWSYSPLVAAHFATTGAVPGKACAIWRLEWQRVHQAYGIEPLALRIEDIAGLKLFGEKEDFTPWDLFRHEGSAFSVLIEPPSLNERIVAQAATFTISTDTSRAYERFLADEGLIDALTKFIIPAEATAHMRDQLDLAGVEERYLFPDLDGVAESIRRYYA